MRIHSAVGDGGLVAGLDLSFVFLAHSERKDGSQARAEVYVDAVVGDAGRHHWELEVRQTGLNVEYVGRRVGSGIEGPSCVARLIHEQTCLIHHRHRHHPCPFLSR